MSLWKKAVTGEVLMNGSGDLIECATCPCVAPVVCPTNCDSCASSYTFTFPAATSPTLCYNPFIWFQIYMTWTAQAVVVPRTANTCTWQSAAVDLSDRLNVTYYSRTCSGSCPGGCTNPWSSAKTSKSVVLVNCAGGIWQIAVLEPLFSQPIMLGTLAASPCPPGIYSDGIVIT